MTDAPVAPLAATGTARAARAQAVMRVLVPALRWVLVPFVAMGGCAGALVSGEMAGGRITSASIPYDVRAGVVYAFAAFCCVALGAWTAPRWRTAVAAVLFALGAALAWYFIGTWYFPERHPRAYQVSRIPVALTIAGGLLAVGLFALRASKRPAAR